MSKITKPQPQEYANFFRGYIDFVGSQDIMKLLEDQGDGYLHQLMQIPESKLQYSYASGKWKIAEVLGHVNDVERVMGYRAFRFSRNDKTQIPGFDDHLYVNNGDFARRPKETFIKEFEGLRQANVQMLKYLSTEQTKNTGKANDVIFSVRALAYILAGHLGHHIRILNERYGV